jgi:hypothetical protein
MTTRWHYAAQANRVSGPYGRPTRRLATSGRTVTRSPSSIPSLSRTDFFTGSR